MTCTLGLDKRADVFCAAKLFKALKNSPEESQGTWSHPLQCPLCAINFVSSYPSSDFSIMRLAIRALAGESWPDKLTYQTGSVKCLLNISDCGNSDNALF